MMKETPDSLRGLFLAYGILCLLVGVVGLDHVTKAPPVLQLAVYANVGLGGAYVVVGVFLRVLLKRGPLLIRGVLTITLAVFFVELALLLGYGADQW